MRNLAVVRSFVLALLLGAACVVPVDAQEREMMDLQGFLWGHTLPDSVLSGDTLQAVATVDGVPGRLGVDLANEEMTAWLTTGPATGMADLGGGIRTVSYLGGRIEVYRDSNRDAEYGTFPPNAMSPRTFRNGEACLTADLANLAVYWDDVAHAGAFEAALSNFAGPCEARLQFEYAYFFGTLAGGPLANVPSGYKMGCDATIEPVIWPGFCLFPCMQVRQAVVSDQGADGLAGVSLSGSFRECEDPSALNPAHTTGYFTVGSLSRRFPGGSLTRSIVGGREVWRGAGGDGSGSGWKVTLERSTTNGWNFTIGASDLPIDRMIDGASHMRVELGFVPYAQDGHVELSMTRRGRGWVYSSLGAGCAAESGPAPGRGAVVAGAAGVNLRVLPNPSRGETTFLVKLPAAEPSRLQVFDVRGRLVSTLQDGPLAAGLHPIRWRGTDALGKSVPRGIYLYRLDTGGRVQDGKIVLTR